MKPDYNLCDVCSDKVTKDQHLFVPLKREMDGAGSYETTGESYDLCARCAINILASLLKDGPREDYQMGNKVVTVVTNMKSCPKQTKH